MNVLSLFDGASCGRVALESVCVDVDKYYSSEIDKFAIKVAQSNHPDNIMLGDIEGWRTWNIEWGTIDLLIGGSPCQGFSQAGKGLAFNDPRSKLFFTFLDILNHIKSVNKSVKFMLENVKMKEEYVLLISDMLGVEPVFINSKEYSACSRPRLYWYNWSNKYVSKPTPETFDKHVDFDLTDNTMSDGWHRWWEINGPKRLLKCYSKIVKPHEQGITMVARQYANWNGNYIKTPFDFYRKPTKEELARLVGLPDKYFESVSQRQTEIMTGNGWTIPVIKNIFRNYF